MCHEWNMNTDDIMMTWFTLYVNLGMSHLACMICKHTDMAHLLYVCKTSMSKYSSGLACMHPEPNLVKITASLFQVLYTQNALCKPEHAKHDPHCISP